MNQQRSIARSCAPMVAAAVVWVAAVTPLTPAAASPAPTVVNQPDATTRTVTDFTGRQVTIPTEPQRIGVPVPAPAEDVLLFGGCNRIAAASSFSVKNEWFRKFCPSIATVATPYEDDKNWNYEEILNANVDLQLAQSRHMPAVQKLADINIPSVILNDANQMSELRDYVVSIRMLMGPESAMKAKQFGDYFDQRLAAIKAVTGPIPAAQRRKVMHLRATAPITVMGGDVIMQEWIDIGGGVNVAQAESGYKEVSLEQVLAWNPDVITVDSLKLKTDMVNDSRWAPVKAVQNGKVIVNPAGAFNWQYHGAEEVLQFQRIAETLHPDLFSDLDIAHETTWFYQTFFGYNLSDAEAQSILNPTI